VGETDSVDGDVETSDTTAEGSGHDRQVLVVGGGLTALATVGFLDQAGLDPVLADSSHGRQTSSIVPIWGPGLELLKQIGLYRPVIAAGTSLDELGSFESSQPVARTTSSQSSLVAVDRDWLVSLFHRRFEDRIHTIDESVVSVSTVDSGVLAAFEHDVTEQFDAVVVTDPSVLSRCRGSEQLSSVHWWSFDWPVSVPEPNTAQELWTPHAAALTLPSDGSVRGILISERQTDSITPLARDCLAAQFSSRSSSFGDVIAKLDESALEYRQLPRSVPATLCVDNVALVGPAVHASIPGDCLGPALSIEDGWVLADALAYGPVSHREALQEYADRRRQRLARINSTIAGDVFTARVDSDLSGAIWQLCARRTLAFGHLFETIDSGLVRDIPEQL
jgi:2-polyprenyl-6-methoxyphenol hydroxylase-like FAD-dependent oxidoreductase